MKDWFYGLVIVMLLIITGVSSIQAVVNAYYWAEGISTTYSGDGYKCVTVYTPKESTSCFIYE